MGADLRKLSIKIHSDVYEQLNQIATKKGESISQVIRELISAGLSERVLDENTDLIADLVRKQVDASMKIHVERLAALTSKSGHMSATAAFLNVQALIDLVPQEKRKDVKILYENARKKAVEYMRTKTTDWEK